MKGVWQTMWVVINRRGTKPPSNENCRIPHIRERGCVRQTTEGGKTKRGPHRVTWITYINNLNEIGME